MGGRPSRGTRAAVLAAACAGTLGAVAPAALGASVEVTVERVELTVTAAPGETNRMTITREGESVLVADSSVAPTPGRGCKADAPERVRCDLPRPRPGEDSNTLTVELGDGDDTLEVRSERGVDGADVRLGDGDDTGTNAGSAASAIMGGAGRDVLTGGTGHDALNGGPGDDALSGGDGDDHLDGFSGTDDIRGGRGRDSVQYGSSSQDGAFHTGSFNVTLDGLANDGLGAENDAVHADVEDIAVDSSTASRLVGDARGNRVRGPGRVYGRAGSDRLTGGDSTDDRIYGEDGNDKLTGRVEDHDVLSGGRGDDRIRADDFVPPDAGQDAGYASPTRDRVRCGPGRDTVVADPRDSVASDCERVRVVR